MLTTLKNAFKIKEIRQKILFTLGMLVVIRIGSQLPVPGVDTKFFSQWFAQQTGGAFSFFDFKCVFQCCKHYITSAVPPRASIFSFADALNASTFTSSFLVSSPFPRIFHEQKH